MYGLVCIHILYVLFPLQGNLIVKAVDGRTDKPAEKSNVENINFVKIVETEALAQCIHGLNEDSEHLYIIPITLGPLIICTKDHPFAICMCLNILICTDL